MARRLCQPNPIVIALALASLFPLYAALRQHTYLNDDTYITLTYAKNLAAGNGFVYNHPPPTLGTTTPLFTFLVAGLGMALPGIGIDVVAVFFTALCWIAVAWVPYLFRSTWQLRDWQAGIQGAVVIASGWVGNLGMEAYLFALLLMLSLSLFFSGRHLLAGLTAGLLSLTRGEGVLVFLLILITAIVQEWLKAKAPNRRLLQPALRLGAGFAIPVGLWLVFAQLTFGTVLPNTLAAKQAQAQIGAWKIFLERLILRWVPAWGRQFRLASVPILNLWWLAVLVGVIGAIRHRRRWLILLAWLALYVIGYATLGVSTYWWYQLPILFVLQLFFGLGIITCVEGLSSRLRSGWVARVLAFLPVSLALLNLSRPSVTAAMESKGDPRGPSYLELARWLRENTSPSESVAYIEIGYLGYYTDNRIIDLAGLTLPDLVPHIAEGDFAYGFWHYTPDYYVYLPEFDWALGNIRANPEFDRQYQPVATLPGPSESDFVIYRHRQP